MERPDVVGRKTTKKQYTRAPMPPWGSPPLQSGGQNQKWPTKGPGGYITPAAWGSPRLTAGGRIKGGPQVGQVAT